MLLHCTAGLMEEEKEATRCYSPSSSLSAGTATAATPKWEGVVSGEGSCTTAAAAAPETGSGGGGGAGTTGRSPPPPQQQQQQDRSGRDEEPAAEASTVGRDAPNIPNVVEYHLKIKPQTPSRRDQQQQHQQQQQLADTTAATLVAAAVSRDMKKDSSHPTPPSLTEEQRKELTLRLSKLSIDSNVFEGSSDLPQVFQVKYLGSHDARGLWGIKHTRKPVDNMVASAKSLPSGTILPFIKLVISEDGVGLLPLGKRRPGADSISRVYPIESISYGVQDLVYTRVFSMIVVRETEDFRRMSPFECHGFVCESKHHARQMTYALAAAFQIYSQHVKDRGAEDPAKSSWGKGFAIDLRNPNEVEVDYTLNPED